LDAILPKVSDDLETSSTLHYVQKISAMSKVAYYGLHCSGAIRHIHYKHTK